VSCRCSSSVGAQPPYLSRSPPAACLQRHKSTSATPAARNERAADGTHDVHDAAAAAAADSGDDDVAGSSRSASCCEAGPLTAELMMFQRPSAPHHSTSHLHQFNTRQSRIADFAPVRSARCVNADLYRLANFGWNR